MSRTAVMRLRKQGKESPNRKNTTLPPIVQIKKVSVAADKVFRLPIGCEREEFGLLGNALDTA